MDVRVAVTAAAMKSFSAMVYVDASLRSTDAPVHDPSAAWRTAPVTRLPTAAVIS
jgi:hypothetical protein